MFCVDAFDEYIQEQLDKLNEIIIANKYSDDKCINFIPDYEWEDELSHNDIHEIQKDFMKKAKEYLVDNHNGKFVIFSDWCVHICTIKFYETHLKSSLSFYERC